MRLVYNVGNQKTIGDYETMQEVWDAFTREMAKRFVYLKGPINIPFLEAKGFTIEETPAPVAQKEPETPVEEKKERKTNTTRRTSKK